MERNEEKQQRALWAVRVGGAAGGGRSDARWNHRARRTSPRLRPGFSCEQFLGGLALFTVDVTPTVDQALTAGVARIFFAISGSDAIRTGIAR